MGIRSVLKVGSAAAVALTMGLGADLADAKTLKLQASSKAGDWAHRFMTDNWGPKLEAMLDTRQRFNDPYTLFTIKRVWQDVRSLLPGGSRYADRAILPHFLVYVMNH